MLENTRYYADCIANLVNKSFPGADAALKLRLTLDKFNKTVRLPNNIERAILFQHTFTSLDAAVEFVDQWILSTKQVTDDPTAIASVGQTSFLEGQSMTQSDVNALYAPKQRYEPPRVCFNCKKSGHFIRDCTAPPNPNLRCKRCSKYGHFERACPNSGNAKGRGE